MPEMLLEAGYLRYLSDLLLHLAFCHFCHDYCVHAIPMSFELGYVFFTEVLTSIFMICAVTSTSLQSSAIGNADFRDSEFH